MHPDEIISSLSPGCRISCTVYSTDSIDIFKVSIDIFFISIALIIESNDIFFISIEQMDIYA
jgi:hypothetical protein